MADDSRKVWGKAAVSKSEEVGPSGSWHNAGPGEDKAEDEFEDESENEVTAEVTAVQKSRGQGSSDRGSDDDDGRDKEM